MRVSVQFLVLLLACVLPVSLACCRSVEQDPGQPYRDATRFEQAIQRFEKQDARSKPPPGAVVCVGSSSIRMWHGRIADDLAPLTLVPRGFGGSNMNDLLHYLDRVVIAYRPRAVVIYEGDNDISQGVCPSMIANTFDRVVERLHDQLPDCRVYVLSIKPSPARWQLWPKMVRANELLKAACRRDKRLTFIDVASPLLGEDGQPVAELFVADRLHLSPAGYDRWRDAVRPVLVSAEARFEPSPSQDPAH